MTLPEILARLERMQSEAESRHAELLTGVSTWVANKRPVIAGAEAKHAARNALDALALSEARKALAFLESTNEMLRAFRAKVLEEAAADRLDGESRVQRLRDAASRLSEFVRPTPPPQEP